MSGAWKQKERQVASWWKTCRNPLSGRNNVNDRGEKRLGDIVCEFAVVEVKRRKSVSMAVGRAVRTLARKAHRPWIVYEFETGAPELVKITVDARTGAQISNFLRELWAPPTHVSTKDVQTGLPVQK